MLRIIAAAIVPLAALAPAAIPAFAADYPEKPVTFIVPFAAGSATDVLARVLGDALTQDMKQRVLVDARGGAGGNIGAQVAAKAQPDGYTVFITTNTTQAANQHLYKQPGYDAVRDFAPVTGIA